MAKPILLVTRRMPAPVEERAQRDYDARLNAEDRPLTAAEIVERARSAPAILCVPMDRFDAALIAALPESVRVISTFSVGYEHIALAAARERGIAVCNTPEVLSVATAEIAMLLIVSAARRASEGERVLRSGGWTGLAPTYFLGHDVAGMRLGIFGMGRIGRELAARARAFGMEIHYRNRRRLDPEEQHGAIYHETDESFLGASQVLSLNAPATPETRKWLNAERIAKLPEGAIVVNTARGALVDDDALIAALRSGRLSAAGLDVYEGEPKLNPGYVTLENVTLLPHLGSSTIETRIAMGMRALDGIDAVLAGRRPRSLVT